MEEGRTTLGRNLSSLGGDEPSVPVGAPDERVAASIENWKRKLLDLSKRNRALNFRMSKVSTIAIVDEQPAEVFRQLHLCKLAMALSRTRLLKRSEFSNMPSCFLW